MGSEGEKGTRLAKRSNSLRLHPTAPEGEMRALRSRAEVNGRALPEIFWCWTTKRGSKSSRRKQGSSATMDGREAASTRRGFLAYTRPYSRKIF